VSKQAVSLGFVCVDTQYMIHSLHSPAAILDCLLLPGNRKTIKVYIFYLFTQTVYKLNYSFRLSNVHSFDLPQHKLLG